MAKSTSSELYELIRSLNKGEKTFFRNLSTKGKGQEPVYLQLFNELDRQEAYDEKAAVAKLGISPSRISDIKNYLYQLVLGSLEQQYRDRMASSEIRTLLSQAEILLGKNLYRQCLKVLGKAKKIALENENFPVLIEISMQENHVYSSRLYDLRWLEEEWPAHQEAENRYIEQLQNLQQFRNIVDQHVIFNQRHGSARNKAQMDELMKLLDNPYIKDEGTALSQRALLYHYILNGSLYYKLNDAERSLGFLFEVKKLIDSVPGGKVKYFNGYVQNLNNLLVVGLELLSFETLGGLLQDMKKLQPQLTHSTTDILMRYYFNALQVHIHHARFDEAAGKLVPEITAWLRKEGGEAQKEDLVMVYNFCAILFFCMGRYKESLQWLNKIVLDRDDSIRQNIHTDARLLALVVHYELGNSDLLANMLRSAERYISAKGHLGEFEKAFLRFLKKAPAAGTARQELRERFSAFHEQLLKLPGGEAAAGHGEVLRLWVQARMKGSTVAELMKAARKA